MAYLGVADLGFPLKDIKVRGDLEKQIEIYKNNEKNIYSRMYALKERIGVLQFNHSGRATLVELHKLQNNSPVNILRWRFFSSTRKNKPTVITSPFATVLRKKYKTNKSAIHEIISLRKSIYWDQISNFEKERSYLNLAMRANVRILDELYEIQSLYFIEEEIKKAEAGFISETVTN